MALISQPSYFSVNFLSINTQYGVLEAKIPNKDLSWSKSEKVYSRLYLNKLESIMRALSDALPTGHRAMANPTLQLHFGCGRATPPISHSHNWPSGRMQHFLFKIGPKKPILPIKTQKLILTFEWYYRSLYCRSKAMIFKKMANFKVISSSATLSYLSHTFLSWFCFTCHHFKENFTPIDTKRLSININILCKVIIM